MSNARELASLGKGLGVDKVSINDDGVMNLPFQPAFHAYNYQYTESIGANVRLGMTNSTSNFGVAINNGNHFNPATGVFTAPVAGMYQINGSFTRNGGNASICFLFNGTTKTGADTLSYGDTWQTGTRSEIAFMNVGDTVQLSYGSVNSTTVSPYRAEFSGHLIG